MGWCKSATDDKGVGSSNDGSYQILHVPDTVLGTPYTSPYDFTQLSCKKGIIFIPIFQIKKLRLES